MAEYGDQVNFDYATGKEVRTPVDDAWVIENVRYVELSVDKPTIKADGEDSTTLTLMLKTGELVSKPTRMDVLDDVLVGIFIDGDEKYTVPFVMGEAEVTIKAVFAGKYVITVDGFAHNELVIEATDGNTVRQEETVGASEVKSAGNVEAAGVEGISAADDGSKGR
jgi:hypothetical protein